MEMDEVKGFSCPGCKSEGFEVSKLGPDRCTFCDGTEGGCFEEDSGDVDLSRFFTGFTRDCGANPFELVSMKIPANILGEVREFKIQIIKGLRGYGKAYEVILYCEKDSAEERFFKNDPLFEQLPDANITI